MPLGGSSSFVGKGRKSENRSWNINLCKKFDFTFDEGKGGLNPSRDKNQGEHRRRKVEKSCVTPADASTTLTSGINGMTTQHPHKYDAHTLNEVCCPGEKQKKGVYRLSPAYSSTLTRMLEHVVNPSKSHNVFSSL